MPVNSGNTSTSTCMRQPDRHDIRDRVWIVAYIADWNTVAERRSAKSPSQVAKDATDAPFARLHGRGHAGAHGGDAQELSARPRLAFGPAPAFPGEYRSHKPVLGRGVHGIPNRVDRIAALGNAVLPQIPEILGRSYLASLKSEREVA